jgi:hypothetical protein
MSGLGGLKKTPNAGRGHHSPLAALLPGIAIGFRD